MGEFSPSRFSACNSIIYKPLKNFAIFSVFGLKTLKYGLIKVKFGTTEKTFGLCAKFHLYLSNESNLKNRQPSKFNTGTAAASTHAGNFFDYHMFH